MFRNLRFAIESVLFLGLMVAAAVGRELARLKVGLCRTLRGPEACGSA